MLGLYLVLMIVACVLLALAAYSARPNAGGRPAPATMLLALGLLAWALVPTIQFLNRI